MASHILTEVELSAKKKKYINVFWGLVVLTVVELLIVQLGHWFPSTPHWVIVAGVVLFSCAKAVVVGYYYMHLEYETFWLKFVALLPLIAFVYAFFLVMDVKKDRHITPNLYAPARVYPPEILDRARLGTLVGSTKKDASAEAKQKAPDEVPAASANSAAPLEIDVSPMKKFSDPNAPEGRVMPAVPKSEAAPAAGAPANTEKKE